MTSCLERFEELINCSFNAANVHLSHSYRYVGFLHSRLLSRVLAGYTNDSTSDKQAGHTLLEVPKGHIREMRQT